MQIHNLTQGSPEWLAYRAQHFNASDAPAMLGCSPHKTRQQLLHELHTGLAPDVDPAVQRRFDDGHRFEALARPLAEQIIGEDLYPVTGSEGRLSASFDGLTLLEDVAFEHKSVNDELRAAMVTMDGSALPKAYRVQMEQQCLVSGCRKVLFMATRWHGGDLAEQREAWYLPDPVLRAEIVAGWAQFEKDLAAYVPPAVAAAAPVAQPVEALPAPVVQVTGQLALTDNFKVFEERLRHFIDNSLIREPKTDEDFVNLDAQIKAMKAGREALKGAKAQMLAQVQPVDRASKTADMLDSLLQQNCSMAERLLKDEKERRRGEIVADAVLKLREHIAALNARLGRPYMPTIPVDFGGVVKGLKSLASMEDKVGGELLRAKLAANEAADRIQANLTHLREHAKDHGHLFADAAQLVLKAPDDLAAVAASRIAAFVEQERAKEEATRERIRGEEQAKAQQEAAAKLERERAELAQRDEQQQAQEQAAAALRAAAAPPAPVVAPVAAPSPAPVTPALVAAPAAGATLTLGNLCKLLAPITITADGLRSLGFEPAGRDRSAVLYHQHQVPDIAQALIARLALVLDAQGVAA